MGNIYRYIGCDEQTTLNILKEIFQNNRIWFSLPSNFNDPMEFNCRIDYDRSYEVLDGSILHHTIKNNNGKLSETVWEELSIQKNRIAYQEKLRRDFLELFRIICFSRKYDNNLMWSHYAGKHSGICLVIDSEFLEYCDKENEIILAYGDVVYGEEPPLIRNFHDHTDNVVRELVFNKSSDWSYEAEYRVLAHGIKLDNGHMNIARSHLVGVILGKNAPKSVEEYCLHEIKAKMGFSVKKAHVSTFSYKMMFEDL